MGLSQNGFGPPAPCRMPSATACRPGATPSPPKPSGKCTQARPASKQAFRKSRCGVLAGGCSATTRRAASTTLSRSVNEGPLSGIEEVGGAPLAEGQRGLAVVGGERAQDLVAVLDVDAGLQAPDLQLA